MHKLISRLEKNEPCVIFLEVSMELRNARYQPYKCLDEPGTIKAFKEEGIIRFTSKPLLPTFEKEFDAKITLKGSEIFFSADCYDDPTQKFKLELSVEVSKKKDIYRLIGFDGRDDITLFFRFQ